MTARKKTTRKTERVTAEVRTFLEAFGARAWDHAADDHGFITDNDWQGPFARDPYWGGVEHYLLGFDVAFEVTFGRRATRLEEALLKLYWFERAHNHLLIRGTDTNGFTYGGKADVEELNRFRAAIGAERPLDRRDEDLETLRRRRALAA